MSTHPDVELLAALALGEEVPAELRTHVDACAPCRAEVEALGEAREALRAPLPRVEPVPPGLRRTVLAAALGEAPGPVPNAPADELAGRRADLASRRAAREGRRVGAGWLVAAAVAGILVGGAGVAALGRDTTTPSSTTVVLARANLDTLDSGQQRGTADLVEHNGVTDLAVHTDPMSAGSGYLEVWLINKDLKRMVAIGLLEPGATNQTFTVPSELVAEGYVIVDISREPLDEDTTHSGNSIVRGTLA